MKKNDLLIDSSGFALSVLEKILDAKIEVKGIENIPEDYPRIFVANHFTRTEAMLVPFALYNITNKKVGVIADDKLFNTPIGNLLTKLGALKTSEPFRNNIILGDLLTSQKDWMVFPEGRMVKAKDITKEDDHYCVNINDTCQRVHTGSAYFALNSQLLRKNFFDKKIKNIVKFKRKYFLQNTLDINKNETKIIPINISYSKLRRGKNLLMSMVDKLFSNMGENFKEELEIESNIILHSTMTINILEPIGTNDILLEKYNEELDHSKIINKYRENLTHHFMTNIYEKLTISFEHIFVLILYLFPNDVIEKNHFKRLLYLVIKDIKKSNLFFTEELNGSFLDLISYEKFKLFDEVLNIAIQDDIIIIHHDSYIINKGNLTNNYTHDTIRLKNILKVVLNEVLLIKGVLDISQCYIELKPQILNDLLCRKLKTEELNEFEYDYTKYWHHKGIKDKKIGKPYLLEAKSDICVVAIHGFSSSPKEVEKLAIYLNEHSLNVYAPRLKGHGTVPEDLKNITYKDWYDSVSRAITIATLEYKKIYLLGFSTGGLLALLSAKKKDRGFDGLICINAALNLNDIRVKALIPAVSFWNDLVNAFDANEYAKEYINNIAENPDINYDKHYIDSISQLSDLMEKTKKNLKHIKTPTYIIQSSDDPVVNPSSAYEIYDTIENNNKKIEIIESKSHVIITQNNPNLFENIKNFIIDKY